MSKTITSQTTIAAPPDQVWDVLVDFGSYPEWNPFVTSILGDLRQGARLAVRITPAGGKGMAFSPVVTELRDAAVLEWQGHLLIPGIFDGRHRFELTPNGDGTTSFVQSETFSGVTIPFVGSMLEDTRRGFEAFNAAIKARSERACAQRGN